MKTKIFIISALYAALAVQFVSAGHTIVIKSGDNFGHGKTEVDATNDTISVIPGVNATFIDVSVKDSLGNTISQNVIPTNLRSVFTFTLPDLTEGSSLEISDDQGVVYTE